MKAIIYAEVTIGVKVEIDVDDFENEAEDAVYDLCNEDLRFVNLNDGRYNRNPNNLVIDVREVNHFENVEEIGD